MISQLPHRKPAINLIAMDLDNTLLLPDKSISPANIAAVKNAYQKGIHIVLASARPISSIKLFASLLGIEGYCVGVNGGIVSTVPEGKFLRVTAHSLEFTQELIEYSRSLNIDNLFVEYTDRFSSWNLDLGVREYMNHVRLKPKYPEDISKVDEPVCKMVLCKKGSSKDIVDRLKEQFGDKIHIVIWEGNISWVEVLPAGINKATALEWLTSIIGVKPWECMTIGDEDNDIEMLRWAGIGVAMGQGNPRVKAAADFITSSYLEDGCAEAINKFVL